MEALYAALRGELWSFKEHVRNCQQTFDMDTLYNVLLLLFPGGKRDIQSLEQLEKLAKSREWDGKDVVSITAGHKKSDIPSYISWFISYVRYLGSLKEEFDTKIVLPLSVSLYVNDDPVPPGGREGQATASVARTAKQLFALTRKWALLLRGGRIDEQAFSHQSLLDLQGFADIHPFARILRLVPDLFHKSLASAELAQQWVERHASRHSSQQACSDPSSARKGYDTGMALGSLEHQPESPQSQHNHSGGWLQSGANSNSSREATIRRRNEVHAELVSLLWKVERPWIVAAEIRQVNARISSLQIQREDKQRELEAFEHQRGEDNRKTAVTQPQTGLRDLEALERQLRLEQYRKNILQGDWLIELEVRPVLLRQIHTLQERCQKFARVLRGREEAPKDLPQ